MGVWIAHPFRGQQKGQDEEVASRQRLLMEKLERRALALSDVISFHHYGDAPSTHARITALQQLGRPVWLTEFMARPRGSRFDPLLALLRAHGVPAFCWGLVAGRTQTTFAWKSWGQHARGLNESTTPDEVWFHDILKPSGASASDGAQPSQSN